MSKKNIVCYNCNCVLWEETNEFKKIIKENKELKKEIISLNKRIKDIME